MERLNVGIADYKITNTQAVIATISLGSCIGVVIYDRLTRIAGLAHILLPDSRIVKTCTNPLKFVDTGVRHMIDELIKLGANRMMLCAKIAGGAQMFESAVIDPVMMIGMKNVEAVKSVLKAENITLISEDTGKNYGRSLEFFTDTRKLVVKSILYGAKEL
jgi:chemotaxis protein CheD